MPFRVRRRPAGMLLMPEPFELEPMDTTTTRRFVVLQPDEHFTLTADQFGMEGLTAIESIGPFVSIRASGPLITVHDSTVDAGLGIGHHPHRMNERLFYIEEGELDHDDALNKITGHMDTGDVGQFTEGQRGMVHSEWNHGSTDARAYILVYTTDPIPPRAAFDVLKDAEAPRYDEGEGVQTKELVGPRSRLRVHGDIRFFADSTLEEGASLALALDGHEGGLFSVREGLVELNGQRLGAGSTVIVPADVDAGTVLLTAEQPSRVIRVVHGRGHGLIVSDR